MKDNKPFVVVIPPREVKPAIKRKADSLFRAIAKSPLLGENRIAEKRENWRSLYDAISVATKIGGTLKMTFGNRHGRWPSGCIRPVLEAAVDSGILVELPRESVTAVRHYTLA